MNKKVVIQKYGAHFEQALRKCYTRGVIHYFAGYRERLRNVPTIHPSITIITIYITFTFNKLI